MFLASCSSLHGPWGLYGVSWLGVWWCLLRCGGGELGLFVGVLKLFSTFCIFPLANPLKQVAYRRHHHSKSVHHLMSALHSETMEPYAMTSIQTIDAATHAQYRALIAKADAYAKQFVKPNGWTVLTKEEAAHPDYAAVTNDMRGKVEQYELLNEVPEAFTAYIGTALAHGFYTLTTWTGDRLGTATLSKGWRNARQWEPTYQVYAWMNGREYTGRGKGPGCVVNLYETAASRRKRALAA